MTWGGQRGVARLKVESDPTGVEVEIVARNGNLVNHGDVLMYVDPVAT